MQACIYAEVCLQIMKDNGAGDVGFLLFYIEILATRKKQKTDSCCSTLIDIAIEKKFP